MEVKVVESSRLSSQYDKRYVIVDSDTGEILDDAQGYGYKTIRNAYACWTYKTRDKSKDKEKREKEAEIRKWMKEHKGFRKYMDGIALEIAKGSWGPDDKFDSKLVAKMLKDEGYETNFTAAELLKVWKGKHI